MHHIRPRWINSGGIKGELLPSDYVVFPNIEELVHVSIFWDALVMHALTVDEATAELTKQTTPVDQRDPEYAVLVQEQKKIAEDSHYYLTRASILSLLSGFVEFSLLEVYQLVFGSSPSKAKPHIPDDVKKPLEAVIGQLNLPDFYQNSDLRDTIRNALQHGRWQSLKDASDRIDIYDAFLGVVSYAYEVEYVLRNAGKIK